MQNVNTAAVQDFPISDANRELARTKLENMSIRQLCELRAKCVHGMVRGTDRFPIYRDACRMVSSVLLQKQVG